jgi:hypothetical protein
VKTGERSGVVMMEEGVLFQAMCEEITTCPRGTTIDHGRSRWWWAWSGRWGGAVRRVPSVGQKAQAS